MSAAAAAISKEIKKAEDELAIKQEQMEKLRDAFAAVKASLDLWSNELIELRRALAAVNALPSAAGTQKDPK